MARPGVYNIRFSAGKSMKEKLERLAEVLGIDCAARRMPEIFEKALDLALEKKDPKQKLARRRKRQAARSKTRLDEVREHNLLAAAREFGKEFMRGKIEWRESKQSVVVCDG